MLKLSFFCIFFVISGYETKPTLKVFNGTNAEPGEFPFAVQVLEGTAYLEACGGSIISKDWVLTAAHCVSFNEIGDWVGYGTVNSWKSDMSGSGLAVQVEQKVPHPDYKTVFYKNDTWDITHDIALLKFLDIPAKISKIREKSVASCGYSSLKSRDNYGLLQSIHNLLKTPLTFNNVTQPVRLPEPNASHPENKTATLVGWGVIDNQFVFPEVLQKTNLTVYSQIYCKTWFKNATIFFPWHDNEYLCAGNEGQLITGPCDHDSGSPLVIDGVQVGIVSWSQKPCVTGPGVYTKVSEYREWIKQVTGV